jgi:hypothetical protein
MNEIESPSALSPQQLALAYDRLVSARWRGEDEAADPVAMWFEAHWVNQPPPEPDAPPGGASVLGGGGRGIRWYAQGELVFGYVPGHGEGCYCVETAEAVPTLADPWQVTSSPRQDPIPMGKALTDQVLSHTPTAVLTRDSDRK